jgi:acetaldehyde dehydrogenase (acetylating)
MKRVAILGSGLIGCDLLVKCQELQGIELVGFAGRDPSSKGLAFAKSRGVSTSARGVEGIVDSSIKPDLLIDCTSASCHPYHDQVCQSNGIRIVDMTPAKLGVACCPAINLEQCLDSTNINMISCGGQAALPLCFGIKRSNPAVNYVEIISTVASLSVGPGTRKNLSEYIISTQKAIEAMLGIRKVKVIVNISPANPPLMMRTTVVVDSDAVSDEIGMNESIENIIEKVQGYVPGYQTSMKLKKLGSKAMCQVVVSGCGHYLPKYAGNLDIINCAALELIKRL